MKVALVAGESSGDQLGAALITALRARVPDLQCFGVAGPRMVAAGCEAWVPSEELAVMGLVEVLQHLPRLLSLRRSLVQRIVAAQPDVFVGIDSPEFNLGLAAKLKARGLRTVQYVSPQVWAWRQGRVRTIGRSCDLVLCLLPFETEFYERHGVAAEFVGHPLADQIPMEPDRAAARRLIGADPDAPLVGLLPGSRFGEVERLGPDFIAAAAWLAARKPELRFIAPMASPRVQALFESQMAGVPGAPPIRVIDGQSHAVLAAADGALIASGTATLEGLLSKCPMVVAYRLGAVTAFLLRRLGMVKVPYFAQPNLLIGRKLVPELFQEQVSGPALGAALLEELEQPQRAEELRNEFRRVHERLRLGGADRAAGAILGRLQVAAA
jgi:lipid-A-disaccharide synthase